MEMNSSILEKLLVAKKYKLFGSTDALFHERHNQFLNGRIAVMSLAAGQTSLVLIIPTEYTAQVFSDNLKIFSRSSAILNRQ
jgi:hypothetical protein